jgi:NitT/TauT family transport system ATP-binding protein
MSNNNVDKIDESPVVLDRVSRVVDVAAGGGGRSRSRLRVVDDVSIRVRPGETLGLVGPSGCGKTTILNMMAGLVPISEGDLEILGRPVTGPSRAMGYITARAGLMPWRTVLRNVQLGPKIRGQKYRESRDEAMELLRMVHLEDFADWYPYKLSQGMRQRVALARTLATDPAVLLMDEPFAALDVQTKLKLQAQFLELQEGSDRTVIWVTHDVGEAVALCDRVIVLSPRPGRIRAEIEIDIAHPRDLETLRFDQDYQRLCARVWSEFDEYDNASVE